MAIAKPAATTRTGPNSRGGADPYADKRLTSGRISSDITDFERLGGKVEILGITRDWYKPAAPSARSNKAAKTAPVAAASSATVTAAAPAAAPAPAAARKRVRTPAKR